MNVRLEAINLLRKLHKNLKFDYVDSDLKQIAEYLALLINKNDKLKKKNEKLFSVIKSNYEEIARLKRLLKDKEDLPKTKGKEINIYNYLEMKVINEGLELLVKECSDVLKTNKAMCQSSYMSTINIANQVISKNKKYLKQYDLLGGE